MGQDALVNITRDTEKKEAYRICFYIDQRVECLSRLALLGSFGLYNADQETRIQSGPKEPQLVRPVVLRVRVSSAIASKLTDSGVVRWHCSLVARNLFLTVPESTSIVPHVLH
jgi:hypothetical protein